MIHWVWFEDIFVKSYFFNYENHSLLPGWYEIPSIGIVYIGSWASEAVFLLDKIKILILSYI